jgi:hypothetical protein
MDMDQISDAMTPVWFPMLYTFRDVLHYLTGLGLICLFLKIGFGFTLRVIGIYNCRGWGWWLCGTITDTTFMIVTLLVSVFTSIFNRVVNGPEHDAQEEARQTNTAVDYLLPTTLPNQESTGPTATVPRV